MCLLLVLTLRPKSQQHRYFYCSFQARILPLSPLLFHGDSNKPTSTDSELLALIIMRPSIAAALSAALRVSVRPSFRTVPPIFSE